MTSFFIVILVPVAIGLAISQIVPFLFYGLDKLLAKLDLIRIPELILVAITFLFGILGSLAAMLVFRHKTRKTGFKVKFAAAAVLRILVLLGIAVVFFIKV